MLLSPPFVPWLFLPPPAVSLSSFVNFWGALWVICLCYVKPASEAYLCKQVKLPVLHLKQAWEGSG